MAIPSDILVKNGVVFGRPSTQRERLVNLKRFVQDMTQIHEGGRFAVREANFDQSTELAPPSVVSRQLVLRS